MVNFYVWIQQQTERHDEVGDFARAMVDGAKRYGLTRLHRSLTSTGEDWYNICTTIMDSVTRESFWSVYKQFLDYEMIDDPDAFAFEHPAEPEPQPEVKHTKKSTRSKKDIKEDEEAN